MEIAADEVFKPSNPVFTVYLVHFQLAFLVLSFLE